MEATITGQGRGQFVANVSESTLICREHYRLVLRLPDFPPTRPGQFIQIQCREPNAIDAEACAFDWEPGQRVALHDPDLTEPFAMLRRPFSLAGRRDLAGGVELEIIHRVVGVGTHWLSELRHGDQVGIIGPLGNQFTLPGKDQTAILVGGGVGIPPMLYLAGALAGRKAVAFAGALTRDLLPLTVTSNPGDPATPTLVVEEFARHGIRTVISTDDGSLGFRGYVTQALEQYLDSLSPESSVLSTLIYTCGPEPMMKRVAAIAAARGLECQIAVERAMACGMGTCQSCCIRVLKPDPSKPPLAGSDWCYRLACTDGPVFRGSELLW
jgi:dihydroorotate dehydrogenase electron transfer subunit